MTASVVQLHAIVKGHVQGVGFRYFVRQSANILGVTGWVRNLSSGDVEVVAEAERTQLERLLAELRLGPRGTGVTDVEMKWGEATNEFNDFKIKPTA